MEILYDVVSERFKLVGMPDEFEALADGLKLKAKIGQPFSFTYTGIDDFIIEFETY